MKKLILPFVALLIGMAACQKEDTNVLTLEAEHYNGDAKMHIDNQDFAVWDDGDIVWLNETLRLVNVDNTTHQATISAEGLSSPYYASYPYKLEKSSFPSITYKIILPAEQTYVEVDGKQKVAAPMLAYASNGDNSILKFHNVGSVLAVKVLNNTYDNLSVHSIQVIADNQELWGTGNITMANILNTPSISDLENLTNGGDTVTLNCGDGVEVPAEGKVFYIALPTISGAHLTVKVDDGYGIYTLAQTTNTATFARNTLHQVPFKASQSICEDYAERQNRIKYTATSKLSGFEEGNEAWGKRILHHDYDATSQQGTIIFNSDITELPYCAFEYNNALLSVEVPESVETIVSDAFYKCGSLTSVSMPGVTLVGWYAFYQCTALTAVNLPNVTSIGGYAFLDCSALTTLNLSSVTSIGECAFFRCTALTTVNLPSITRIDINAFYQSGIQSITLGPNLGSLGVEVFASCNRITDIYCKAQNPPISDRNDFGSNCFGGINTSSTLHVPSGRGQAYATDDVWGSAFGNTWGPGTRILEDCPE